MLRKRGYVIEARRKKQEDPETVALREMVNKFCAQHGGRKIGVSNYYEVDTKLGRVFVTVDERVGILDTTQHVVIKFDKPVSREDARKGRFSLVYSDFEGAIRLTGKGASETFKIFESTMKDLL